jgi:hypothetical protein
MLLFFALTANLKNLTTNNIINSHFFFNLNPLFYVETYTIFFVDGIIPVFTVNGIQSGIDHLIDERKSA